MKKLLMYSSLFILHSSLALSQSVWSSRASLPDSTRDGAVGFSIGNYGYIGLGQAPGRVPLPNYKDFWQFNPSTNSWTRMADFPGKARGFAATFVIGNYGYVVTGIDSNDITCTNECWQYNTITNTWLQKTNFPGHVRAYAVGFAIGDKGYVGMGSNDSYESYKDFWAYDTNTDLWTQIANFRGIPRIASSGFSIDWKGYICFGEDSTYTFHRDIWAYDTGTNSWAQITNCPGVSRYAANGFVIGKDIFIGTGQDSTAICLNDFWKYNIINDTWQAEPNFPGTSRPDRSGCSGFAIGDTGYFGLGVSLQVSSPTYYFNDLYRFLSDSTTGISNVALMQQPSVFPNPFHEYTNIEISNSISQNFKITCYDILGREQDIKYNVSNEDNITDIKIFKGELLNGIYMIRVDCMNKESDIKIIVN